MNGSLTQFTNLMRFPQLGPISHKFTMKGGHSFVSIEPHTEYFHKGERGEGKLEADHWQRQQWPSGTHWLCTGSQGQQHPHLNHFSPPAAAREAASCALAIWPEEQIPKRNLNYTVKLILATKTRSQKGFSLVTKDAGSFFFLFVF